jgi:hypothetical protein
VSNLNPEGKKLYSLPPPVSVQPTDFDVQQNTIFNSLQTYNIDTTKQTSTRVKEKRKKSFFNKIKRLFYIFFS